ncbi:MAG: hypothetical protein AAB308_13155, partial [Nitrospirota bacterium]
DEVAGGEHFSPGFGIAAFVAICQAHTAEAREEKQPGEEQKEQQRYRLSSGAIHSRMWPLPVGRERRRTAVGVASAHACGRGSLLV